MERPKTPPEIPQPFTEEQIAELLDVIKRDGGYCSTLPEFITGFLKENKRRRRVHDICEYCPMVNAGIYGSPHECAPAYSEQVLQGIEKWQESYNLRKTLNLI